MKRYLWLKAKLLASMLKSGKLTPKKVANMMSAYLSYIFRSNTSSQSPSIVFFELSNRCNLHCVACRESPAKIYDQNPRGGGCDVPIGDLPAEIYRAVIDDVGDRLMMAVLYVNGEPLLRSDLFELIRYATQKKVATMISTNGMLLTEERVSKLLECGVDFIKIAVSGFTQEVYGLNHRGGDVEVVKTNLETLSRLHRARRSSTIIMLDYIVFEHNIHETSHWQRFSDQLGFIFNLRTGISQGQTSVKEIAAGLSPAVNLCDWLWKIATINWDGTVFPCCEFATWKGIKGLGTVSKRMESLSGVWNGAPYQSFRKAHRIKGRSAIPRCVNCHYKGIRLQG
jgi:radical SAM protein with 4Fe4S-binding SPASM domain